MEPKKYPFKKPNPNLNPNSNLTFKPIQDLDFRIPEEEG
jgi:hypothetical protein